MSSFSSSQLFAELQLTFLKAPNTSRTFEFPQNHQTSWGSPFPEHVPTSAGHSSPGDASQNYWGRHADSPMTPGFSPHLSGPTSSLHSATDGRHSFTTFAPSRSDSGWLMPTRSMSFGLVEDLPLSYQHHYHQNQSSSLDFRRRGSDMRPPSLQTSTNSSNGSMSEAHITPLSASVSSPPLHQWGIPTTWGTLSANSLVSKASDYSGWYSDPAPLAKVQEEEIGPHYSGEPAILYAGAEQQ